MFFNRSNGDGTANKILEFARAHLVERVGKWICRNVFLFGFVVAPIIGAEPIVDPVMPGYLRVRFADSLSSQEADSTLKTYGLVPEAKSGALASPQWRRIRVEPFTEDVVSDELRKNSDRYPDLLDLLPTIDRIRANERQPRLVFPTL